MDASRDLGYRIGPGDILSVRVWNQDTMSAPRTRVRDDGMISLPFLQDIEAEGLTPTELAKRLEVRLKSFVVTPIVTVTVEEIRPVHASVLGEVTRPGQYPLDRGSGVLQALAAAGGMTQYADANAIYVIRQDPKANPSGQTRIRFQYKSLVHGSGPGAAFRLRDGDVVVVE
jgi:polysaccharide export outer membrane protein